MDFEQIKELINMVNNSELRELQLSLNGTSISMSKNDGALKPVKILEKIRKKMILKSMTTDLSRKKSKKFIM